MIGLRQIWARCMNLFYWGILKQIKDLAIYRICPKKYLSMILSFPGAVMRPAKFCGPPTVCCDVFFSLIFVTYYLAYLWSWWLWQNSLQTETRWSCLVDCLESWLLSQLSVTGDDKQNVSKNIPTLKLFGSMASHGIRTWRRVFLLPWLIFFSSFLVFLLMLLGYSLYCLRAEWRHVFLLFSIGKLF